MFCILVNCVAYSQLVWEETNTGTAATISIGEFSVWGMSNPTLDGNPLPAGSLIGAFYLDSDNIKSIALTILQSLQKR